MLLRKIALGRITFGILGFVLLAALLFWRARRLPQLLDVAKPVLSFDDESDPIETCYLWLTDDSLLVLYRDAEWRAYTYSCLTPGGVRDTRLERTINGIVDGPRFPCSSPDGQWLAWYTDGNIGVCSTDGTKHFDVSQPSKCIYKWTQDSQSLLQLFPRQEGHGIPDGAITRISDPRKQATFKIASDADLEDGLEAVLSADRMLTWTEDLKSDDRELALEDVRSRTPVIQRYLYRLPSDVTVKETAISPGTDRLCWLLQRNPGHNWLDWLGKHVPLLHHADTREWSLWISRLDGEGMGEIGYLDAPYDDEIPALSEIKWSPSGRQVGFRYGDRLWMVTVN